MQNVFDRIIKRLEDLHDRYVELSLGHRETEDVRRYLSMSQAVNLSIEIVKQEAEQEEADIPIIHGKEELKEHDKIVYNQAIDDFAKDAKKMADRWFGNCCINVPDINEIAENLKKV